MVRSKQYFNMRTNLDEISFIGLHSVQTFSSLGLVYRKSIVTSLRDYHWFLLLYFSHTQHGGGVASRGPRSPPPLHLLLRGRSQLWRLRGGRVPVGEHLLEAEADAVLRLQTFLEQKKNHTVFHQGPEYLGK